MQLNTSYQYIPVTNLQQALKWYSEHLGFKLAVEDPICLELRTESGVRVFLIPNDEGKVTSHMNYANGVQATYGFTVAEDIHSLYQQFKDKGIKVGKLSDYQGLSFKFFDPDGNAIELWGDYPTT
ncbi:VOC family protein [Paenibacillus sp. LHD-38]|uniref:VOC family protein n=1 Tax=Paenibacillus sp. LHD-38 TaxID=3072143 RepID=UPI00280E0C42|nr:VOC family protein [Paenibacillus sp. LHD-38]MDQ8738981.1 VOC family protein [Paenibacillus sp. LHD-38]